MAAPTCAFLSLFFPRIINRVLRIALAVTWLNLAFVTEAAAQTTIEYIAPVVTWETGVCNGGVGELRRFASPQLAFDALQASCTTPCMEWNGITQANPTAYSVSGTVYQTCNPPIRSNPITQDFAVIVGYGSCDSFPGYLMGNHPDYPFGACYIYVVEQDQSQKKCDVCAGNPIFVGTGNKRQVETDYVGSGVAPLTFQRTYNSAAQFGAGWRHSFRLSIKTQSGGGKVTATLDRPDASYTFVLVGSSWVADADVNYQLYGYIGSFTVITPEGDRELYNSSNNVYQITSHGWAPKYTMWYGGGSTPKLAWVIDPFGRAINLTYDTQGRMATMVDPGGGVYEYIYGANDTLVQVNHPDGSSRQYVYAESSLTAGVSQPQALTGIVDENSQRHANFGYGPSGHAVLTEYAGGANRYTASYATLPAVLSTVTIDVPNHVKYIVKSYQAPSAASVTDPLGQVRNYSLTAIAGTVKSTGATQPCTGLCSQIPQARTLDANGNATSETDFNGVITTRTFDTARNLETSRMEAYGTPLARTITTIWHPTFRSPSSIVEAQRTTTFTYNAQGMLLSRIVADAVTSQSRTWTYTYDSFNNRLTEDGPRTDVSDVTTYTYHSCSTGYQCGRINTITNAQGHVTTYNTYSAHGQPLTITDPNGVVTTLTYDLRQRLTSRTVGTETTTFEHWPTGLLKKATLPDNSYIEYFYDAAHRLTDINDADGNRMHYALDAMGNRIGEQSYDPSNALTRTSTRVFNMLSRLQQEIGAAGTANVTTTFGYDSNGNQTSIAAPLGRNTIQDYDELNRLKQVTDPLNGDTVYGYDALDQLISVTDPRGLVTSYSYSALGDLNQQTSPDTGVTNNTYDSGGNLATSTDARDAVSTYTYDRLNRVLTASFSSASITDQTLTYTYDAGTHGKGHLTGVSDSNHSLSWTYDAQGRVLIAGQAVGSVSKTTSYSYANGQRQSMTTPSGQVITYGYTNGKVTSVSVNGTLLVSNILYDPFGPVRQWTWSNGSLAVRTFDQDGKVTQIDSEVLKTYSYDDAFRITGITDTSNSALSWTYGYDDLDRLTAASNTGTTQGFTYDANGNRLTQAGNSSSTFTVAANSNRLSSTSGTLARTYGYDNAGNTTSYTGLTFAYNNRGRMSSSTKDAVTTSYIYNALGQLIKKGANTLYYYDDAGHVLGAYSGTGVLVEELVWLGDIPIVSLRPRSTGGINIYNIHTDHLNTPRLVTGSVNPGIRWRWDADPFGGGSVNNNPSGVGAFEFNLRFPGQIYVAETGLNYNYYRDYDPQVGRYVQSDPMGLWDGVNTYGYVHANPVSNVDPSGLGRATAVPPTPSSGEVDVSVRCGRLPAVMGGSSGGVHCEVVAVCKKTGESVAFGIGGGGNGIWERLFGGKEPPKYQNPAPRVPPSDVTQYTATCGKGGDECDGCKALECFKKMQSGNTPPPYYALWQNSNEYAHSLLNQCGCSVSGGMRGPPGAVAW